MKIIVLDVFLHCNFAAFLQPVRIVRLPPESLIPAEAQEKQKYPLLR